MDFQFFKFFILRFQSYNHTGTPLMRIREREVDWD